jgi:serine protease inhibitor ecotin
MRTKSFDHGELKHPFSQVKRNLNFQEILKLAPLPQKKKKTSKKVIVITMKEDEKLVQE